MWEMDYISRMRSFELSRLKLNVGQGQRMTSIRILTTGGQEERRDLDVHLQGQRKKPSTIIHRKEGTVSVNRWILRSIRQTR